MILKKIKATYVVVVIIISITGSCSENYTPTGSANNSRSSTKLSQINGRIALYTFDGKEGNPIDLDVANRWIANYTLKNNKINAHYFGNKVLLKLLSKKGSFGVRFYYSKDDNGTHHLIAVPVDANGNDFSAGFEARGLNSSFDLAFTGSANVFNGMESDSVSISEAQHSISNFSTGNTGGIVAHFFGFDIINQILSQSNCVGLRCYFALDDNGVQQLLLVGATKNGQNILPTSSSTSRTEDAGGTIADVSVPCPAMCSGK